MANSSRRRPLAPQAVAHRGHRVLVQEPLRAERHHQQAVGVLGGGAGQLRPKGADVDRRRTVGVRAGVEGRRHQRVPVVLAAKVQAAAGIPGLEDRAQGSDQLGHAGHRVIELRAESLLDLRADLSAQAEEESPAAQQLVIIGLVRQVDRIARKRDRHVRHQVQTAHRGGQRQRSEHVVLTLEGGNAAGSRVAQLPRALGGINEPVQRGEDLQSTCLTGRATALGRRAWKFILRNRQNAIH